LQFFRQIGALDPYPALFPQGRPERCQRLRRRAHAAFFHKLIELVGGGCNAIAKKQQYTNLAIQLLRARELRAQLGNLGVDPGVRR
jgi:hypothetical protein